MRADDQVTVELLDPDTSSDDDLVRQLTDLVNDVYAVAEDGMWVDGTTRITAEEMRSLIADGEVIVARSGERGIVGLVRVHDADIDTSELGILVAAPDQRGLGIGRALVDEVERRAIERGQHAVQLELLVPREWSHPSKEFLSDWYGRRGYQIVRISTLDESYGFLTPYLATPCDLQIRRRPLA